MAQEPTNMRVLRSSREQRVPGDFFAYEMPDGVRRYGRLIARSVGIGNMEPTPVQHLVYFYGAGAEGEFDPGKCDPHRLLVPPLVVNQKPWTLGLFERVARLPLRAGDVLPSHGFYCGWRNQYFDEMSREISQPAGPCGEFGLHSYLTVDRCLSEALGFVPT